MLYVGNAHDDAIMKQKVRGFKKRNTKLYFSHKNEKEKEIKKNIMRFENVRSVWEAFIKIIDHPNFKNSDHDLFIEVINNFKYGNIDNIESILNNGDDTIGDGNLLVKKIKTKCIKKDLLSTDAYTNNKKEIDECSLKMWCNYQDSYPINTKLSNDLSKYKFTRWCSKLLTHNDKSPFGEKIKKNKWKKNRTWEYSYKTKNPNSFYKVGWGLLKYKPIRIIWKHYSKNWILNDDIQQLINEEMKKQSPNQE